MEIVVVVSRMCSLLLLRYVCPFIFFSKGTSTKTNIDNLHNVTTYSDKDIDVTFLSS